MPTALSPTANIDRIPSLDFLRGIAILGILFINIENFAYPDPWSPWKYGYDGQIDHATRFWVYFLTQGKFYTMFALLFGVGFYIFLERMELKQIGLKGLDIFARRLLWLFVIGIVHAYFIWDGDVLYHYATCGLLLFPFRSMGNKTLLLVIGILGSLQLVKSYELTQRRKSWEINYHSSLKIPEEQRSEKDNKRISFWENKTKKHTPDTSAIAVKKQTYFTGVQETYEHAQVHKGLIYHKGLLFSSLMVMILGIVLYRIGVFKDYHTLRYYWPITLGILILGLTINYVRYYHWTFEYFDPVTNIWKGWLFTFPKELLGVGYILVINGLFQKFLKPNAVQFISNIGKMALTNYIFQSTLLGIIFYGYGLGFINQFSRFELLGIVIIIWILQLVLSNLWLRKYPQGPLEWFWRKLTYQQFRQ